MGADGPDAATQRHRHPGNFIGRFALHAQCHGEPGDLRRRRLPGKDLFHAGLGQIERHVFAQYGAGNGSPDHRWALLC